MYNIIPGVLNSTEGEVFNNINKVKNIFNFIQIDICDGVYVDSLTWLPKADTILPSGCRYELDLMVSDPYKYIEVASTLKINKVIIHSDDITEISKLISFAKDLNIKVGLSAKPEMIKNFINEIDYIQIMGIDNIGRQGQKLKTDLIKDLIECEYICSKSNNKNIYIQIDGGMNLETIKYISKDREYKFFKSVVMGSAVFRLDNIKEIKALVSDIKNIN